MKKLLLTACLATLALASRAQDDTRPWMPLENRVGISLGIGRHTFLDQNTSPLVYESRLKNVKLFYQLESNHILFTFDIDVSLGGLQPMNNKNRTLVFEEENRNGEKETKRFPAGGSMLIAKVGAGCFYKIKSTQESTFKVAAGLRISKEVFYPQGWTPTGLMSALSFSPQAIAQHRIDEHHKFTATVRLPVLAYVARLPYHNSVSHPDVSQLKGFAKNSEWTTFNKFAAPQASLGYDYQISNHWGTGLTYDFSWYNVTTEQKFRAVSQSLKANFYHQF
jgi:hypothetical protein